MTHIEKLLPEDGMELFCLEVQESKVRVRAKLLADAANKLRGYVASAFTPKPRAQKRPIKRIHFRQIIHITAQGRIKPLCDFVTVDKTQQDKPFISQFRGSVPRHVVGTDLNAFNRRCARMYRELIGRIPIDR